MQRQKKPIRVRGYRIRVQWEGMAASTTSTTIWCPEPLLPEQWEATRNDPQVLRAVLIRSGKPFAQYIRG